MNASDFPATSSSTVQIHSYAELQQQIHDALRAQHPEWVAPDGNCPTCESYERRLAERLDGFKLTNTIWSPRNSGGAAQIDDEHECSHRGYRREL